MNQKYVFFITCTEILFRHAGVVILGILGILTHIKEVVINKLCMRYEIYTEACRACAIYKAFRNLRMLISINFTESASNYNDLIS